MEIRHSNRGKLLQPENFFWAALDEYELTQHYQNWRQDIDLMRELGVTQARYGIPWHRINPSANAWDWGFPDGAIDHLLDSGIQPILDLVHYGLPAWIEGAYLNRDFPRYMAEYARRAAERYKGRIYLWTPLNEPRVTAWYCGKLGWWPPFRKGWRGFLGVMMNLCRGIVETSVALREADPENLIVHVDATDLYESEDPALGPEVERRQEIVFLALDLISGRVTSEHALFGWLLKHGVTEEEIAWFGENAIPLDIIGINLYPLFSRKILKRSPRLRIQMPYASGAITAELARMYYQRYGAPVFISETASLGSVKKRSAWLRDSVEATRGAREEGVPIVGYTWWPLFALITWAYRQGKHPPEYYLKQMGLWDLRSEGGELIRARTALVDEYKALVESGATRVGKLRPLESAERMTHV
jgi:beta-glucosidase/6-phospho-beta-glucosidase/beta-galactosidase